MESQQRESSHNTQQSIGAGTAAGTTAATASGGGTGRDYAAYMNNYQTPPSASATSSAPYVSNRMDLSTSSATSVAGSVTSSAASAFPFNVVDPLTPNSRRALESATLSTVESKASSSNFTQSLGPPSSSNVHRSGYASTHGSSHNHSQSHIHSHNHSHSHSLNLGNGMTTNAGEGPVSPHRMLLDTLDSMNIRNPAVSSGAGGAPSSSYSSRSVGILFSSSHASNATQSTMPGSHHGSFSGASNAPASNVSSVMSGSSGMKKYRGNKSWAAEDSSCGSHIVFGQTVRIRLNNHRCLRVQVETKRHKTHSHGTSASGTGGVPPASAHSAPRDTYYKHVSTIDVNGTGYGVEEDQIFVLMNASLPEEIREVRFSDDVALYCVGGSAKGRFLSADVTNHSVTTRKGPIFSNAEKWRLLHPSLAMSADALGLSQRGGVGGSAVDNLFLSSHDGSVKSSGDIWKQYDPIMTSDEVVFKTYTGDLCLSVINNVLDEPAKVVLAKLSDDAMSDEDKFQVWEITKSNIPYDPSWNREREFLTMRAFLRPGNALSADEEGSVSPIASMPPSVQETIMIDELLYTFMGIEGRYIKLSTGNGSGKANNEDSDTNQTGLFRFGLNQYGMDTSIASLVARCLPLGECYLRLCAFVEERSRYEFGQVSHAFCAAVKSLLKEYTIVIAQIENQLRTSKQQNTSAPSGPLNLQKLWYYVQPSLRTMEMLSQLVETCAGALGGGALLSAIQKIQSSLAGDSNACKVFDFLLERSSVPYLKMVERWIYHGDLIDPYDEFMIRNDETLSKEELSEDPHSKYWQSRFTLRTKQVPLFLSRFADKILSTGKYLNVFRTCKRIVDCPFAGTISFCASERYYEELIEKAHSFASHVLLKFYLHENDLMNRFASLKHYFLMDQGDLFVDFMDVAEEELKMRADKISLSRLESLLHLSLQTSTCASDPYKEDLVCFLSSKNLISQMEAIHERSQKDVRASLTKSSTSSMSHPGYKVIDALTLDYKVKWPLSLVISSGALLKYQMIFRHLFFCKHVERKLGDAWLHHQTTKELQLRSALVCLRQRMLHFQQNYVYYMMFEVISPRWHAFHNQMQHVTSVDEILNLHRDFLDTCLKECLLTDPELIRVLTKLMTVCTTFANSIECFTRPYFLDEETIKAEREAERDRRAEKKAREEAEAAIATFRPFSGSSMITNSTNSNSKGSMLRRRQSSVVDMRRARIKELSDDVNRALTEREGHGGENPFVKMTSDLENQFDSLLAEFIKQLLHRSALQFNTHLSNLCTRLDYNGFYTREERKAY